MGSVSSYLLRNPSVWSGSSMNLSRTSRGATATSGVGVTNQYDRKRVYRYRRMPRGKKRRWVRSLKRNFHQDLRKLATRTMVRNHVESYNVTDKTKQLVVSIVMGGGMTYSAGSQWNRGYGDLFNIFEFDGVARGPDNEFKYDKVYVDTQILDMTVQNDSTWKATEEDVEQPAGIELDVYEVSVKKLVFDDDNIDIETVLRDETIQVPPAGASSMTALAIDDRGATPFEFGPVLGDHRIKIWKKTKYFLAAGETMTYQFRNPKNYVINVNEFRNPTNSATKCTRGVLFIAKMLPTFQQNAGTNFANTRLTIGNTRKYKYKLVGNQTATSGKV